MIMVLTFRLFKIVLYNEQPEDDIYETYVLTLKLYLKNFNFHRSSFQVIVRNSSLEKVKIYCLNISEYYNKVQKLEVKLLQERFAL